MSGAYAIMPGDDSSDGANYSYVHIALSGIHPDLVTLPHGQTGELSPRRESAGGGSMAFPFRGIMKRYKMLAAVLVAGTIIVSAQAQSSEGAAQRKTKYATKHKGESVIQGQLRELREQMQAQQLQIDALTLQLSKRDEQVSTVQQNATAAQSQAASALVSADKANTAATESSSRVETLQSTVTDLKSVNASLTDTILAEQKQVHAALESPTVLHYKGVTITPVAFFALEGVHRQRSMNSDINTPFNIIPFPGATQGHVSELNFSGRQSRLGGLFEANAGNYKLTGYFESDFLGVGTASNNNESNSYVLRQRQIWGKAETKGGFGVVAGQMWSLVTETGKSTENRTEKLPNSIDPQYVVGYSWARQPAVRFQQRFGDVKTGSLTLAMSIEQAQITGFNAAGPIPANFFFAGNGQNGGLYNAAAGAGGTAQITTYANNVAPDVILKATYDLPSAHFELGGLSRFMRDFYYPILTTTGTPTTDVYTYATNYVSDTKAAGGVFGSARVTLNKYADVAVQAMAGQGTGRYGSSQLSDTTLRPDGTLEPIRNYHGMLSLETHPIPKLDVYGYYGGEYAQRTVYKTATGALMGYGPQNLNDGGCYNLPINPGSSSGGSPAASGCASPTRYIQEGMLGLTYRAVNSPKYGRLQYQFNYQYIQRNLWSGVGSVTTPSGPRALNNMFFVGTRYYIP